MATWPKAPQDYDSFFLNHCQGPLSKTQKFQAYRDALKLASEEIARLRRMEGQAEFYRTQLLTKAIEAAKKA